MVLHVSYIVYTRLVLLYDIYLHYSYRIVARIYWYESAIKFRSMPSELTDARNLGDLVNIRLLIGND